MIPIDTETGTDRVVLVVDARRADRQAILDRLASAGAVVHGNLAMWNAPAHFSPTEVVLDLWYGTSLPLRLRNLEPRKVVAEEPPKVKDLKRRIALARRQRDRRTETMLTKELRKIWSRP